MSTVKNLTSTTSTTIRCLIVDDEAPARDELRYLLEGFDGIQVVGAAATAEEAELLLSAMSYDVVFLDIRMPGCGGLDLAARLDEGPDRPEIVFTTAYPDHAVAAFELSAADYLLKPFDRERLSQALGQVANRRSEKPTPGNTMGDTTATSTTATSTTTSTPLAESATGRLPIRRGDRVVFLSEDDLFTASAARGYCYLTLDTERVLTSYSLAELEERLSSNFFRPHRSHLVNLQRVAELRADFRGGLALIMSDAAATVVPVSRRLAPELRKRLGL